jgi:hypothetical protein
MILVVDPFTPFQAAAAAGEFDGEPFRFVVQTTGADTFYFHPQPAASYADYRIDWGDGAPEEYTGADTRDHTYPAPGLYEVQVWGRSGTTFPGMNMSGDSASAAMVAELVAFGSHRWPSMSSVFEGCVNMVISATDAADSDFSIAADWSNAFKQCISVTEIPSDLNTSAGEDFSAAWAYCGGLTSFPSLDFENATSMAEAWRDCTSLTSRARQRPRATATTAG